MPAVFLQADLVCRDVLHNTVILKVSIIGNSAFDKKRSTVPLRHICEQLEIIEYIRAHLH